MKKCRAITLKYAAIGFACLVIAMATTRVLDLPADAEWDQLINEFNTDTGVLKNL